MSYVTAVIAATLTVLVFGMCSSAKQSDTGIENGNLKKCPSSPNCVSTFDDDEEHSIKPAPYTGSSAEAKKRILSALGKMKRVVVVTDTENYIRCEFRSTLFRFVDDVEFYLPENEKIIHMRSASRTGYSDMGVNRKRIEEFRRIFESEKP
jgi:uncharacterized protein (DUF1499 family)